jgi:hypothetical protein
MGKAMRFNAEDLDWAMGELFALFARAARLGTEPHLLDPALFHEAWTLLNAQPFVVARELYLQLMRLRVRGSSYQQMNSKRRYVYEDTFAL